MSDSKKVKPPKNGRLYQVLMYARYSKEDQNPLSITDQFKSCRRWLDSNGYEGATLTNLSDEGISGEILKRPGIDRLRTLVRTGRFDLVLAEEVSRFYRDRSEPHKLAGECLDHETRFVTVNDDVDTLDPLWDRDLADAAGEHTTSNQKTSKRIRRAAAGRFEDGYALGPRYPGYTRKPVDPARYEETRKGPFLDAKDEAWTPVLREAFERVARGDPLRTVARFMTEKKFPKYGNAKKDTPWKSRNAKAIIRNPVYKGTEVFRKAQNQKHYASGRHMAVRSEPDEILSREVPHMAHVSASLWQQANDAISSRNLAHRHPKGMDNPHYRVPRDSRGPLSGHFYCSVCGKKMIGQGRDEGGYRCGNALQNEGCWNRASALSDLAHRAIIKAVAERVMAVDDTAARLLVELTKKFIQDGGDLEKKTAALRRDLEKVEREIDRYTEAVTIATDLPSIVAKLQEAEGRRSRLAVELEELETTARRDLTLPSDEEILQLAQTIAETLLAADEEAWLLLRTLTTPIQAVPFQRVDCGLVVLKARFELNLVALLPEQWRQIAKGADVDLGSTSPLRLPIEVDLFKDSGPVKFAREAFALSQEEMTAEAIARRLGTTKWTIHSAIKLGKMMDERGLTSAYAELTGPPTRASRWGHRDGTDREVNSPAAPAAGQDAA